MLFGDSYNEITLHWLDPGIDTGDIIAKGKVVIKEEDTGYTCGHRLTEAGRDIFRENWPLIKAGNAPRLPQDTSIASNYNFTWEQAEIDWRKSALEIWNLVRSISRPLQGAWTVLGGTKIHIWKLKVVDVDHELASEQAIPGQILAVTGKGLWVQTGEGQVQIIDSEIWEDHIHPIIDLLLKSIGSIRVILG